MVPIRVQSATWWRIPDGVVVLIFLRPTCSGRTRQYAFPANNKFDKNGPAALPPWSSSSSWSVRAGRVKFRFVILFSTRQRICIYIFIYIKHTTPVADSKCIFGDRIISPSQSLFLSHSLSIRTHVVPPERPESVECYITGRTDTIRHSSYRTTHFHVLYLASGSITSNNFLSGLSRGFLQTFILWWSTPKHFTVVRHRETTTPRRDFFIFFPPFMSTGQRKLKIFFRSIEPFSSRP